MSVLLILGVIGGFLAASEANTLSVSNGGDWGDWGLFDTCPQGTYAVGYNMKIEESQGWSDDTALNGIKLVCKSPDDTSFGQGAATSSVGPWGNWKGETNCQRIGDKQHFLTAFSLQVEGGQGSGDDTAANFLKFKCRDKDSAALTYELSMSPGQGLWGSYGGWSSECPIGQAICGIKTRVERPQGGSDDTALNDVVFMCCN